MMDLPRITVVIPSLNQAPYLDEAICSVLEQDYPRLEFMIIDGGSTDGSRKIIERYVSRLAYWCSEADRNQSHAIAKGFGRATGDLLGWLNSDDVYLPGALLSIGCAFQKYPNAGILTGHCLVIDQHGKILWFRRPPAEADWFGRRGLLFVSGVGTFVSRRGYDAIGGLNVDLDYAMDTDLWIRMMAVAGARLVHVRRYLGAIRIHPACKTVAMSEHIRVSAERVQASYSFKIAQGSHRKLLMLLYRAWQVVNGNHLRAALHTLGARGQDWRDWAKAREARGETLRIARR